MYIIHAKICLALSTVGWCGQLSDIFQWQIHSTVCVLLIPQNFYEVIVNEGKAWVTVTNHIIEIESE